MARPDQALTAAQEIVKNENPKIDNQGDDVVSVDAKVLEFD